MARLKRKTLCVNKRGDTDGLIIDGFGSRIWMVYAVQWFNLLS